MYDINFKIPGAWPSLAHGSQFNEPATSTAMSTSPFSILGTSLSFVKTLFNNGTGSTKAPESCNQMTSSDTALLNTAQRVSDQATKVSSDVLTSFVSSIDGFKQQISSLEAKIDVLEQNQQLLQGYCEIKFKYFPKLPSEIRRMVWQYYLNLPLHSNHPQVFSVHLNYRSCVIILNNPDSALLRVCKESRTEALLETNPLSRYDSDSHILWASEVDCECHIFHDTLAAFPATPKFGKFAIDYEQWLWYIGSADQDEAGVESVVGPTLSDIHLHRIDEIILVVGDASVSRRRDIIFVPPKLTPQKTLRFDELMSDFYSEDWYFMNILKGSQSYDWDKLEKHSTEILQKVLNAFMERRERKLRNGVTKWFLMQHNNSADFEYLHECQFWKVPKLKIMQVTTLEDERRLRNIL